jgi:predicted membrane chloride channel (bestrophin family)
MFISFRLNNAFGSWSTGVAQIGILENTSSRLLSQMYAVLLSNNNYKDYQQRLDFCWKFKKTVILYIANVFQNCSGDNGRRDGLREYYLTKEQLTEKNRINSLIIKTKDTNTNIVETCMHPHFYTRTVNYTLRELVGQAAVDYDLHPSVAGSLSGKINNLSQINNTLYGMSNVPVVYTYNRFINFIIFAYIVLYMLTIIPESNYFAGIWVFIWSCIVFLANSIADEIESPFGIDNNDMELEIMLCNIKDEYSTMFNYISEKYKNQSI